jgi:hypothetical protein
LHNPTDTNDDDRFRAGLKMCGRRSLFSVLAAAAAAVGNNGVRDRLATSGHVLQCENSTLQDAKCLSHNLLLFGWQCPTAPANIGLYSSRCQVLSKDSSESRGKREEDQF